MGKEGESIPIQGPVSEPSDLKTLKIIHPPEQEFMMLMLSKERLGKDVAHVFHISGPFRESWAMLGSIEKLLYYYKKKPGLVKDLARIGTDYVLESVDKAADLGADVVAIVSDLYPYHVEINALAHKRGMKVIKHSDGNLWPIMDRLVESGFDGIHPIQPQCMDIGQVKAKYHDRCCLLGNIDCEHLLPFGSEEEVDKTVKETIAAAAPGGGYIISSSNTIHPGCKGENYVALVKAARKYGSYPIQISN